MHRVDSPGAVDGRFQDGNPAIGQQATMLRADWCNAVQEEIASVIEGANLALAKGDNTQLYEAIVALVAGVVGDGSGAVATTRNVLTAGLATGGGNLSADRTITVPKATAAETAAQLIDTKAVTPLGLAGLVGLTVVGSAWVITLGQTIVQIFPGAVSGNATTVLSLPQAFPTECKVALCNGGIALNNALDNNPYVSGKGTTSVSIYNARDEAVSVEVIAIGR